MQHGRGFIAALDQSGGSTPKALGDYGVTEDRWTDDAGMFDLMHQMRSRIIESPAFGSDHVLAAIMFDDTMERTIAGQPAAAYLWSTKGVVPILKVDQGLAEEADGVQLMKPLDKLPDLLTRAVGHDVFGTKMRSVVKHASPSGIAAILDQQFEVAEQILDAGLLPILEPEVDIRSRDKAEAEVLLAAGIVERLAALDGPAERQVMLKLSLPSVPELYADLATDPRVLRVVALSGGYSRDEACERLAQTPGMIASFSRALTQGLREDQADADFDTLLAAAVHQIFTASVDKV